MSRMPFRQPMLNPEHPIAECTCGAIIGDNSKSGDCPAHGLFAPPKIHKMVPREVPFSPRLQEALTMDWRDSRGKPVIHWPSSLLPSSTIIIYEPYVIAGRERWKLLVHQRSDNHSWGFVGGRQEIGESIRECAVRETKEETGLDVTLEMFVGVDSDPVQHAVVAYPDGNHIQYTNCIFLATVTGGTLTGSHESVSLQWVWEDDLPQPFLPAHQYRLQQAIAVVRQKQPVLAR